MRRIAIALTLLALVGGYWACSSDAPVPTPPGGGGSGTPPGTSPVQVRLFTSNPNPTAGTCTLIQAVVTVNGANAADGTGVAFSTDFGTFSQNTLPLISVTTQSGVAITALCSTNPGLANVRATVTVGANSGSATIAISFQPSAQAGPFFTSCSPSFGPNTGGTSLTITGGRFPATATTANTRVTFTAAGITREALVTAVTPTSITLTTPAFPEAVAPSVPVNIAVSFNSASGSPVVLTVPNCFAFGTTAGGNPSITTVLPSSGSNEGNTRVTIFGSGFVAPLQVFFGNTLPGVEATVVSISFNQIVALTPPAFGAGAGNLNQTVNVRVHEVNSGLDGTLNNGFRFTPPVQIISFEGANIQSILGPFTPLTIHGQGFQAPVKVSLAGFIATVMSVSATEILVLPGNALATGCTDVSGPITVTNIDTGDTATGQSFTYLVKSVGPIITGVSSSSGTVTITGANFVGITSVTVGGKFASFSVNGTGSISVSTSGITPPACPAGTPPGTPISAGDVTVTNSFGCSATASGAFTLPCQATAADVAIVKTANPGTVSVGGGGALTFNLAISNSGGTAATSTIVTDSLPAGVTFNSCSTTLGSCSFGGGTVTANLGTVGGGGSATVTINVTVTGGARTLVNTATVSTATPETNFGNNSSSASVTVNP